MIPSRRSTRFALALLVVSFTGLVACTGQQQVTDYGPEAEANFVGDCTKERTIVDGEQVVTELASKSYCECVYDGIANTFKLPWDDLIEYEDEVAKADDGDLPPPPAQLDKAMVECSQAGPTPPSDDTDEDASTTTEG